MPEIAAQLEEVLAYLGLCNNIQVATKTYLQLTAAQQFQVTCLLANRPSYTFSNSMKFTFVGGEESEDTISFAKVRALEDDGLAGIAMLLSHMWYPDKTRKKQRKNVI
jgi:hypothetical protein